MKAIKCNYKVGSAKQEVMKGIFFDADLLDQNYGNPDSLTLTIVANDQSVVEFSPSGFSDVTDNNAACRLTCSLPAAHAENPSGIGNKLTTSVTVTATDSDGQGVDDTFKITFANEAPVVTEAKIYSDDTLRNVVEGNLQTSTDYWLHIQVQDEAKITAEIELLCSTTGTDILFNAYFTTIGEMAVTTSGNPVVTFFTQKFQLNPDHLAGTTLTINATDECNITGTSTLAINIGTADVPNVVIREDVNTLGEVAYALYENAEIDANDTITYPNKEETLIFDITTSIPEDTFTLQIDLKTNVFRPIPAIVAIAFGSLDAGVTFTKKGTSDPVTALGTPGEFKLNSVLMTSISKVGMTFILAQDWTGDVEFIFTVIGTASQNTEIFEFTKTVTAKNTPPRCIYVP